MALRFVHSLISRNLRICMLSAAASLLLVTAVWVSPAWPQVTQGANAPMVLGLDHIPLAVTDLDKASERYRLLGFTLKPGRVHENGIRNQHIKFPDGTEIELISALEARDPLTSEYLRHLAKGDGPAFFSFYTPDMDRLSERLETERRIYRRNGRLLNFLESDQLHYIFFGQRISSPTDLPEHFRHDNSSEALIGIWIAGSDLISEHQLLTTLGAKFAEQEVHVPELLKAVVAKFQQAEVVFLPGSFQLVQGRRIVGATLRTPDLNALRRVLITASLSIPPVVQTTNGRSLFLPPRITHGIWLEFRQDAED